MGDEPLSLAVAQAIDALSFAQTHEVDSDFRAHSKATMSTLRPLQAEQRNRIDQAYGARSASPDFLATRLLATYRGEAASVQLSLESADPSNTPTAITGMSNAQCRAFKKELKQRIHEWEDSVRDATGQPDVLAEQKAHLRSIYELYKASKNKVTGSDSVARAQSNRSSAVAIEPSQPASHSVRVSHVLSESASTRASGAADVGARSTARLSTTTTALRTSASAEPLSGRAGTGAASAASSATTSTAAAGAAAASAAGPSPTHDRAEVVGSKIPRIPIGTTDVETMSTTDLQVEKRKLKQVLHRFESDFAILYGEPPSRRDRRTFSSEYHRYGLLKTELAKREGSSK